MMHNPRLKLAEAHSTACWDRLVEHAKSGRCTCHLDDGAVVVIQGCAHGRALHEEYWIAAERVRELSPKLEPGDMESTLEAV